MVKYKFRQPRIELLGTPEEIAPTGKILLSEMALFIFLDPQSPQINVDRLVRGARWFKINIELGVGKGRRRQSSFPSKTVK